MQNLKKFSKIIIMKLVPTKERMTLSWTNLLTCPTTSESKCPSISNGYLCTQYYLLKLTLIEAKRECAHAGNPCFGFGDEET